MLVYWSVRLRTLCRVLRPIAHSRKHLYILASSVGVEATAIFDTSHLFITLVLHRSEERCLLTHSFPAVRNLNSW